MREPSERILDVRDDDSTWYDEHGLGRQASIARLVGLAILYGFLAPAARAAPRSVACERRVDGRAGRASGAPRAIALSYGRFETGPVRLTTRYGIVRTTTMLHAYYTAEFLVWNLCARPPHGHG